MAAKKTDKPRILIVDDDEDILDITSTFLEAKGYEVGRARSGEEALRDVKTSKPMLVLMDVMMPKMDGFWLCRVLKSDPKYRTIPIIFLTAQDDAQSRIEGQKCGGDDYLAKPFDMDALEVRIKAQLKRLSKDDLVERIEDILEISKPKGFLGKLDLDELTVLLKHLEAKLKRK
ncbi:MAG: DNA-binding response regulator [Candidatus Abyssobacteria bacterium SURF_17]|uniref:DNA-binding response regulator n=1 Tax=Candidatus Abyssobacteria bacterium SURF_17 TaxID=2093361 RepID=A0A419ETV4_9BACT|nr:MAG: DNA-binding response regulator [Candidatus Abyssubacteria bacterium SURF_17]